jgi:hypothetical protein
MMKLLMVQVLYFAVVVEAGLASILTTFKPEATVNTETGKKSKSFNPNILSSKRRLLCEDNVCEIISDFSLPVKYRSDCYEMLLPIEFQTKSVIFTGYIDSSSNEIYN